MGCQVQKGLGSENNTNLKQFYSHVKKQFNNFVSINQAEYNLQEQEAVINKLFQKLEHATEQQNFTLNNNFMNKKVLNFTDNQQCQGLFAYISEVIISLSLSGVFDIAFDQVVSDSIISAFLYVMLEQDRLRSINLAHQQLSLYNFKLFTSALVTSQQLKFISLHCCALEHEVVSELCMQLIQLQNKLNLSKLEGFDISGNQVGDDCISKLIQSLVGFQNLAFLGFGQTGASNLSLCALLTTTVKYKNLKFIDLKGNQLSSESITNLIQLVKLDQKLLWISSSGCSLSRNEEKILFAYMRRNQLVNEVMNTMIDATFDYVTNKEEQASISLQPDSFIEYCNDLTTIKLSTDDQILYSKINQRLTIQSEYIQPLLCSMRDFSIGKAKYNLKSLSYGVSDLLGPRPTQEDVTREIINFAAYRGAQQNICCQESLFCLFDGHGGLQTAEKLHYLFPRVFAETINAIMDTYQLQYPGDIPNSAFDVIIRSTTQRCDDTLRINWQHSGSTAVVAYVLQNKTVIFNVGDSRAIIVRESSFYPILILKEEINRLNPLDQSIARQDSFRYFKQSKWEVIANKTPELYVQRLSYDHKPDLGEEQRRVESVGGYIHEGRILSQIAVSRAFGDFNLKPSVSCAPHIKIYDYQQYDSWLILGCDGVWDVISDVEVALLANQHLQPQNAAINIKQEASRRNSTDNVTVIAIRLHID